ncbi:hypothetical protein PENFLA_c041G09958 [Penicillium flavigenum]|uniref:DUF7730 domain-containing protein n=1 Tax=Penicillium flavigenum TaxID=254877 RepID=A0A1V6SJX9_9EURO|nr:hypothetical protein PENFLA_c041G09958 [Penicillium flavigenum]
MQPCPADLLASYSTSSNMAPLTLGNDSNRKKLGLENKSQVQDDDLELASSSSNPRPRPLTPPLPENKDPKSQVPPTRRGWRLLLSKRREKQFTFQQTQSPLFGCLPTEIRLLIWEHYLCSHMLHIVRPNQHKWKRSSEQIVGILCSVPRNFCPCSHNCWGLPARRPQRDCHAAMNSVSYFHDNSESTTWKLDTRRVNFVPPLQTCRRVYSEAIDIIFQKNSFLFNHTDTIIDFSHTLLPQRISKIRTLQLSFPDPGGPSCDRSCEVLATNLAGLKTLTIHLYPHVATRLDNWLMLLHQIQQPTVFEVLLIKPWYLDPQWEKSIGLVDAPFRFSIAHVERRGFFFQTHRLKAL